MGNISYGVIHFDVSIFKVVPPVKTKEKTKMWFGPKLTCSENLILFS